MLPSPQGTLERESTGALGREDSFPTLPLPNAPPFPIERFHHVIKNYVSLHNSVILLCMTAVLVYK